MRLLSASVTILAFTACFDPSSTASSPWGNGPGGDDELAAEGPFAFQGSLWEARGLGFEEDGSAQVGMGGNTCDINPDDGSFENDLDVVYDAADEVQDVYGGQVLVLGGGRVSVFVPGGGPDAWGGDVRPVGNGRDDVQAARLVDGGVVALRDTAAGCFVEWSGRQVGAMRVDSCGDLDVDRATGTAFIAHGDSTSIVSPGRVISLPGGDRVAWMPSEGQVVVARAGTGDVAAFAFDGVDADAEPLWLARLDAPVQDVAAIGAGGGLVLNQANALLHLNAGGVELGRTPVRDGNGRLATSADGRQVAVVRGETGARIYTLVGR